MRRGNRNPASIGEGCAPLELLSREELERRRVELLGVFVKAGVGEVLEDEELLRDHIGTLVGSLLGLLGIEADPVKSREHILISTILDQTWRNGQEIDIAGLVPQIQKPSFSRIGALELESFYPGKERFELAMAVRVPRSIAELGGTPRADAVKAAPAPMMAPSGTPRRPSAESRTPGHAGKVAAIRNSCASQSRSPFESRRVPQSMVMARLHRAISCRSRSTVS